MTPEALDLTRQFQAATQPRTLVEIADAIAALASTVDEETGELTPEAAAELDALNLSLEQKVQGYAIAVSHLFAEGDACRDVADDYARRAAVKQSAAKRLKIRLHETMAGLGTAVIKTPTVKACIENSPPSCELVPGVPVPSEWRRLDDAPVDKKRLMAEMKAGARFDFARLVQNKHLRFR